MTKRFLLFLSLVLCGVDAQAVQFRANISWTAPSSYLNATVFTDAADACAQYVAFKGTEWSVGTVMYNPHVGSPQDGRVSSTYYLCSTEHTGGSLRNVHYYNLYVRCEVGDSWVPAPTTLAALGCETEPPPEPCGTEYGAELGGVSPAELATFGTETPACVNNCKANIFLSFFTSGGTPQSKYAWYSTGEDCTGETEATGTAEESACVDNFEQNQNPVVPGYNSGLCVDQADPGDVLYRARDQHIGEDLQEPIGDDIGASRTRVTSDGGDLLLGFTSDPNGGTDLGYGWDLDYIPGRCTHYGHGTGAYTLCGSNAIATNSDGTPATPFGSITVNRPGNFQQTVNFYEGFVHSGGANGPGITEGGGLPGSSGGGGHDRRRWRRWRWRLRRFRLRRRGQQH
ncbi:hypothetical protein [Sinimarinibacterium flocculans]|uniref:hypothetical protein n=1 Tax=Sinimarinibacterium flocculans TaxID=985250 RepID=UPI002492AF2F|nr:hypothetical protein [Sinimarinibacterium flocculans]